MNIESTIIPKSDQLNAEDFLTGSQTATVEGCTAGSQDQPLNVKLSGIDRPWKPCKTMRRVLGLAWGNETDNWIGNSLTLFRDPSVKWAGKEEGGIRISHMSHIDRPLNLQLTVTRGKRKPYKVDVLKVQQQPKTDAGYIERCRTWLKDQGIAESDALAMIGKATLEEATEADFAQIGKMKAEAK